MLSSVIIALFITMIMLCAVTKRTLASVRPSEYIHVSDYKPLLDNIMRSIVINICLFQFDVYRLSNEFVIES